MLATVLSQIVSQGGSVSSEQVTALTQNFQSIIAAQTAAKPVATPLRNDDPKASPPVPSTPSEALPNAEPKATAPPAPPPGGINAPPSSNAHVPAMAPGPATAPLSINPPAATAKAGMVPGPPDARINSSSHPTEYKSFQRFCEHSTGAGELKKAWAHGGAKRMAMFARFVQTGCDALALECALRFKRQREEIDKDEGEYYPWADILKFHEMDSAKALAFITRRRAELRGTSVDRNDPEVETFLYYSRQSRSLINRTIDEIAIELGCDAQYASSICEMLETSGNAKGPAGALPPPNSPALGDNTPPESAPKNGKHGGKNGKAGQPLEVLESQGALIGLIQAAAYVEAFKKHTRVANGLLRNEKPAKAKAAKKAKPAPLRCAISGIPVLIKDIRQQVRKAQQRRRTGKFRRLRSGTFNKKKQNPGKKCKHAEPIKNCWVTIPVLLPHLLFKSMIQSDLVSHLSGTVDWRQWWEDAKSEEWGVLRSDKFAYDKNKRNLTLQSLQREFVASMNKCSDPEGEGLQGYTLHCTVSRGDWKHKREWLEQPRHYSNSSGKICPRCLCEQNWADMTESFNNSADLELAAQSSVGPSIPCRGMHMYTWGVHTFVFPFARTVTVQVN
ncbi:unnamed protein product [Symbiodinium sp. CCMP2592]|nr:unnamed protein product [Symbiodinium sp. CCMP2592]